MEIHAGNGMGKGDRQRDLKVWELSKIVVQKCSQILLGIFMREEAMIRQVCQNKKAFLSFLFAKPYTKHKTKRDTS